MSAFDCLGRLCRCAIGVSSAIALSTCAFAADGDPFTRTYKDQFIALDVDVMRLAVFVENDATRAQTSAALQAHGIQPDAVQARSVPDWSFVTTPETINTQGDIETLVNAIVDAGSVDFVTPVFLDEQGDPMYPTQDLLVRFGDDVTRAAALAVLDGARPARSSVDIDFGGMRNAFRVRDFSNDGRDVIKQANMLAARNDVRWAEADWNVTPRTMEIPNDPVFDQCWGLLNTGQDTGCACLGWNAPVGVEDMDMDADEAWDITTGDNSIIVAVFDTGIDQTHPDLNQITPGFDLVGNPGGDGGPISVCDWHGTLVAGTISAIINNNLGTVGIAPDCRVISMKMFNADNNNPNCTSSGIQWSWVINGLDIAEDMGVRVTNHSYGWSPPSEAVEDKFAETRSNGMVHFASAGNGGQDNTGDPQLAYPSSIVAVNSVAALDPDGTLTGFSNFGPGLFISAPGIGACTTSVGGGTSACFCGTSAASPYTAGVAALVLSVDPSLTAAQVESALAQGAMDLGTPGYDQTFGWGFVNARSALLETLDCPGSGSCFEPNGTPGCINPDCCGMVCAVDPFCCNTEWDQLCASQAVAMCLGCPGEGPCDQAHGGIGCNDADCCELVCTTDSLCCDEEFGWDQVCAGLAVQLCGLEVENDDCADALPITEGFTPFDITNASNDGFSHFDECEWNAEFIKDVWFEYTADCTGFLTVSTCGLAPFQTWVAVYNDSTCPPNFIDLLDCETDSPGCGNDTATVSGLFVTQGETYKIRIGAPNIDTGVGQVFVDCKPLFDECDSAFFLDDFTGTININTSGANTDGPAHGACSNAGDDQINQDVWYDWIAPCTGTLTIDTCGTADFDTKLAVYEGCACPVSNANLLGCNDDAFGCSGFTSSLSVPVSEGQCYKIRVGGFQSNEGTGQMTITCEGPPINDNCEDAALTLLGLPTPFSTANATTDGLFHAECSTQILRDVWFTRTATCTGFMTVSTCDSDFDTMIAVYDGCECPGTDENLLACNDNAAGCDGDGSQVTVPVYEGQCYLVRIGAPPIPVLNGEPPAETGSGEVTFTCLETCTGDFNIDGFVDVTDLLMLLGNWGLCAQPCPTCLGDTNADCEVAVSDLLDVLEHWGPCFPQ